MGKFILLSAIACHISMSYSPPSAFIDIGILSDMKFLSLQVSAFYKHWRVSRCGRGKERVYEVFL